MGSRRRFLYFLVLAVIIIGAALFISMCDSPSSGEVQSLQPLSVSGRLLFDDGSPVEGAEVRASTITEAARRETKEAWLSSKKIRGTRGIKGAGSVIPKSSPEIYLRADGSASATTDAQGNYTIDLGDVALPIRVLVEISYSPTGFPSVTTSSWGTADSETLDFAELAIPNPADPTNVMTIADGTATNTDGSVVISNIPDTIDQLFAHSYDPDLAPDAFPGGSFVEMTNVPLNSSGFIWLGAVNTAGRQMHRLGEVVTIRQKIPPSQWADLEDITSNTDRIEIPIYLYNENMQMWEQLDQVGWLEDSEGTILPEDAQILVLDGTYENELFATFTTDHFSWMNVDYAYIGPWTLSRLDSSKRNNDCLYNAMQLAKKIALSEKGRNAYKAFNTAGADLAVELADAKGPELKNSNLNNAYGEFKGNESGDKDDQFHLSNTLWDGCGSGATAQQKKNTTFLMAVTIVHETAHWKWDVKHENGDWKNAEPSGEAGNHLEKALFGGIIGNSGSIKKDGVAVSNDILNDWMDHSKWPPPAAGGRSARAVASPRQEDPTPLAVTISLDKTTFDLGEEIPVTVVYENISSENIQVLDLMNLEGYPLWFEIVHEGETVRVPFKGARAKLIVDWETDFVTLEPGQTLQKTVNLLRHPETTAIQYNLIQSGNYELTAFYSGLWGFTGAQSNILNFEVGQGGSISGVVSNAQNAEPINGATISVKLNGVTLATATSGMDGTYAIPELPGGTYTVEATSPGFLKGSKTGVVVVVLQDTTVTLPLSPLLAAGEISLVLTWGESPGDLDSHLWLPLERQYHLYYSREGNLEECPFANLDVDDTDSFGPETVTIVGRFEGTYHYAVHNYNESPSLTVSEAQVQVFDSSGLIATFMVPTEGTGLWWHVLSIDGTTGEITEVNQLGDDPAPYQDTGAGCVSEEPQ